MRRRTFLKRVGVTIATGVAALVIPVPSATSAFFPDFVSGLTLEVNYVPSKSAWLVSYWGKLQDGGEWQAAEFCEEVDIRTAKKDCLRAMWRRFEWLNDLDRGEGIPV